jgi:hypothetical protein
VDFTFWACGLLAALIAVVVSSFELLTRYQARSLREIFRSGYYWGFAFLNGLFGFGVYWALPSLGNVVIKSDFLPSVQPPLPRAVIAGLGYLLIARTSVLDITYRGQTRGVGLDVFYQTAANYLLGHHSRRLREALREDFWQVYTDVENDPIVFLATTEFLLAQLDANERQEIQDQLQLALSGEPPSDILCLSLYILIRNMTSRDDASTEIDNRRTTLREHPEQANPIRERLTWLYSE